MQRKISSLENILIRYYGLLQAAHLTGLVLSGIQWLRMGNLGLLALPPDGGWAPQAVHFLVGTGVFDFFVALGALLFVGMYVRNGRPPIVLGTVVLTGSLSSAFVYAYGIIRTGAWIAYPLTYSLIAVVFAPALMLAFVFVGRRVLED